MTQHTKRTTESHDHGVPSRAITVSVCCGAERQDEWGDRCTKCKENTGFETICDYCGTVLDSEAHHA